MADSIQGQGLKFDSGKPRWSLLPMKAVEEQVKVMGFGAQKYEAHSWKTVPNGIERYTDAAFRHLVAYTQGEDNDPESGLHHLAHALCCVSFVLELEKEKSNEK